MIGYPQPDFARHIDIPSEKASVQRDCVAIASLVPAAVFTFA
jgi:hypothetical protein